MMSYTSAKLLSSTRMGTIRDFTTLLFGALPVFLKLINGSASFAIRNSPYMSLHKCRSVSFGQDMSVRSVIYPMGQPFCLSGITNINVILTLIII